MKKDQVDLENAVVWIPDSKTPNGVAEVPLTDMAREAFRDQMRDRRTTRPYLFPSEQEPERVIRPRSRRHGRRRCGGPRFRTFGSTICGRPTPLG